MLKRFLRKVSPSAAQRCCDAAAALGSRPVTVEELRQLIPLRTLSEEELKAFALIQEAVSYGSGSILFERGATDPYVFYLLAGTVTMQINDEQNYEVTAGSTKARFPLSCGGMHNVTAIASTAVEVLPVPAQLMKRNLSAQLREDQLLNPENWEIPPQLHTTPLFQTFCQNLLNEELKLPTLPDIALRLRKAIEQDDIGVAEAARIVHLDATIAARLIHIVNSPLYYDGTAGTQLPGRHQQAGTEGCLQSGDIPVSQGCFQFPGCHSGTENA